MIDENISKLAQKFKVVLIYLENEYSRLLNLTIPISDIVFIVGKDIIPNRFSKDNVEFIKLYETRFLAKKKTSKIKRMLLYNLFFNKSLEDTSSSENLEINPLGSPNMEENIEAPVSKSVLKSLPSNYNDNKIPNPNYRRIHHILSPKSNNFCYKDFDRMGRYLLNQRYGLVLGGGGARGFAHVGVIRALEEENIPIDIVGGTSMGAFVGAIYARQLDYVSLYTETKKAAKKAASFGDFMFDLTYPFASLFSGRNLSTLIRKIFKNQQIQNFWLEYYCVTTSLKTLEECIHFYGSAVEYIKASMSISGVVPPVFYNNDILCDGAYVNNVPTDVMISLDVKNVISVDVGTAFLEKYDPYDSNSGLLLQFRSLFESKRYLSLMDMQYRLAFISTLRKEELINQRSLVITPDLAGYKTSDFHKFDEIVACGYQSAKKQINDWKTNGQIKEYKKKVRIYSI